MRITDKINFRQPKYMLPAIVYIPLIATGYFVFDMFNTEVAETQDKNLQTTEFLNPNLPGAQIKNGDGIGGKYENMAKSYGRIADYSAVDNIERDNEEEKEAYESKYTEEDLAELVRQAEEKDDAAEVADAKAREAEALEALNKALAEARLRGQAAVAPVAQDTTQAGPPKEQIEVKGKVTSQGEPVIGAGVIIKGTTIGSATDVSGTFTLRAPSDAILTVSSIGYSDAEVAVNGRGYIEIELAPESLALDDVVVVGYGTQKRASLTGAISSIDNGEILTTKSQSLAVSLAGKVPGLRIRETNGMPGAFSANINMRGLGTPMIVIDGVVRQETTEFQKLNPDDIESITVLKDASAAIYGINSSNGAILITTKSGKEGPLRVSFSANVGFSQPTTHIEMMNGYQYWEIRNEDSYFSTGTPYFATKEELARYQSLPTVDWYGETFKKSALQQTYNISVEGGNKKIQSYTNVGYTSDNGLLRSGDIGYHKFSIRNGSKYKINDWIRLDMNLYGYTDLRKQPGTWDDAFFYLNKAAHGIIPTETIYANDNPNYYNRPAPINDNPIEFSERDKLVIGSLSSPMYIFPFSTLKILKEIMSGMVNGGISSSRDRCL